MSKEDKYYQYNETKEQNNKLILSNYDYDLYHDEDNVANKVIRIKKFGNPSKGEKWKIFEDTKIVLTLDGIKFTNKEKSYFYTIEGINFLINQYKSGIKTVSGIKKNLKQVLDKNKK